MAQTTDDDGVLSDVGGGHVVVTPGRDGGRGRGRGGGGDPDGDYTPGRDSGPRGPSSGEHGVKLRADAEVETPGGGHAAGGLH